MRYISDDGKVFNTEQECYEYEKRIEQERINKEKLKEKQKERYESIRKHSNELLGEIQEYEKDYGSLKLYTNDIEYSNIMDLVLDYDRIMGQPQKCILSQFMK